MILNPLPHLFSNRPSGHTAIYFTAGFPYLDATPVLMKTVQESGATIIEVGIPYSDPLADGPVIEQASGTALKNGMNLDILFSQLHACKAEMKIPVLLMGYTNQVMQYGWERFCREAAASGVSGLILPDLPLEEYEANYAALLQQYSLSICFLITPDTGEQRREKLVHASTGFVYAVSSSSITGTDKNFEALGPYFSSLQEINNKKPVMVGFGIKSALQLMQVQQYVAGGIVGTAFVQAIREATGEDELKQSATAFLKSLLAT